MPTVPRSAKPIFRVDLFPSRSLSRRSACHIVLFLAGLTIIVGFILWSAGAWPVIGFLGMGVLLLSLAFYFSFRSARQEERIELGPGNLRVTRISVRGERQEFDFQPYWLRVKLERGEDDQSALFLRTHGKSLEIAQFLGADEKESLAGKLNAALRKTR